MVILNVPASWTLAEISRYRPEVDPAHPALTVPEQEALAGLWSRAAVQHDYALDRRAAGHAILLACLVRRGEVGGPHDGR